jgi:hypothetical protein
MKQISMLLLAAALLVAGCNGSNKRIDGNSEAAMQKSLDEIRKSMSAEEKEKFNNALMTIGAKFIFANLGDNGKSAEAEMLKVLNGKTAAEVIAEAEKIRAANKK